MLNVLVNKLGDPQRRTASSAAHLLLELVSKDHPAMKRVVPREVESFVSEGASGQGAVLRRRLVTVPAQPHIRGKTRRAAGGVLLRCSRCCTSGARRRWREEARKTRKPRRQSRRRRDGATETKRAAAAAASDAADAADAEDAADELGPPLRGVHARATRARAATPLGAGVDARVVSTLLTGISRAFPYVDADAVEPLVEKVSPALFAIAHSPNLGSALAFRALLQLLSARAAAADRFCRALYSVLLTAAPRGSSAAAGQLLSLTYRALKDDPRARRRDRQASAGGVARPGALRVPFVDARQRASQAQTLALGRGASRREGGDGDDVERFATRTIPTTRTPPRRRRKKRTKKGTDQASDAALGRRRGSPRFESDRLWAVRARRADAASAASAASRRYDMSKRDPLYARADASCWWELATLERNVHPSVAAMARSLLYGTASSTRAIPWRT